MEGEVELGQIVDISDSIASFSQIENQSVAPESQAEISESKNTFSPFYRLGNLYIVFSAYGPRWKGKRQRWRYEY